jgi:DNA topoisomerase-1
LSIIKDDIGIELIARFENKLEKIRSSQYNNVAFKNEIKEITDKLIEKYRKLKGVKEEQEKKEDLLEELCPLCVSKLVKRKDKYGEFIACSNYPKCKYIKKEQQELKEGEIIEFSKGYKTKKMESDILLGKI